MVPFLSSCSCQIVSPQQAVIFSITFIPRSLLKQFAQYLYGMMKNASQAIKDTSGSTNSTDPPTKLDLIAALNDQTYGIQVGLGTDPVSSADYTLQTPVLNGSSSNQMLYQPVTIADLSLSSQLASWAIQRAINNNSGSAIALNELGLISLDTNSKKVLLARDLLPAVSVPDETTFLVTYTFSVPV